jgi:hypothetical protein
MPNLDLCVRFTNAVNSAGVRILDYIHIPTPPDIDDSFVASLGDLETDPDTTRVYMGIIHPEDGTPGVRKRAEVIARRLPDYGLAYVCGFGRLPAAGLPEIIDIHADAVAMRLGRP